MNPDISDFIVELVRKREGDLPTRLKYQAEAVLETMCTEPDLGRLVDENDVPFLLATLASSDREYAEMFPNMSDLSMSEREELVEVFERHFECCEHCSLKRGFDIELGSRIERACFESRDVLLTLLLEDEAKERLDAEPPSRSELESCVR